MTDNLVHSSSIHRRSAQAACCPVAKPMRLTLLFICLPLLFAGISCIAVSGSGDSEAQKVAVQIWAERFGNCGDSYYGRYSTGSEKLVEIYQYRDVEIKVDSEKISEADKLNGVTWKGRTYFKPKANRWWSSSDRKWTPWKSGAPPMGPSLDMIQRFGKVKGQWTYEHSAFYKPVECSDIPE